MERFQEGDADGDETEFVSSGHAVRRARRVINSAAKVRTPAKSGPSGPATRDAASSHRGPGASFAALRAQRQGQGAPLPDPG
jgi:hypothetical protein